MEFKSVSPEWAAKNDQKSRPVPFVHFRSSSRDSTLYLLLDTKPPHTQAYQQIGSPHEPPCAAKAGPLPWLLVPTWCPAT